MAEDKQKIFKKLGPKSANKRGSARLAAVQALYQMDIAGLTVAEIIAEYKAFRLGQEIDGVRYLQADSKWFQDIVTGVVQQQSYLDPLIRQQLVADWSLSRLDSILRAILRAGSFEIINKPAVPLAVIINEYVDIAKAFFCEEEPKMVHAILDRLGKQQRGDN